ncbi:MAG: tRNA 2-thiocytidine biosynthesis protein TtcA [Clostridiales bacterium]|nr:tRNA 2-thiocytidine biosynthesis protein TtcA [Clostridiales bacterium]
MKKTLGCLRKADQDFGLIEPGDRIAVGISGGKDSLLLLHALSLYRQFSHKQFSLLAVTVKMGLEPFDLSGIRSLCGELEVPYLEVETQIGEIIFDYRKEKNPCALCSKMRRAVLANTCRENGCGKLALGHHREDAIETLLLSLFYEGRFHTFHPKTLMSRSGITVIRPLVYLPEKHVIHMMRSLNLPVVTSPCPVDHQTRREDMHRLLSDLKKRFPDAPDRFLHALQHEPYDLWQKDLPSDES